MSSSPEPAPPRAFMSYSQDDTAHMGWVQQLAARLVRDGVDVTLDQWDLKAGLNLNLFMESGLTESDRCWWSRRRTTSPRRTAALVLPDLKATSCPRTCSTAGYTRTASSL
ncbi:TIR domain-containing protein [Rhodococcus hoagii]|nr:TIR domain-containing protein [Prescottella equi]